MTCPTFFAWAAVVLSSLLFAAVLLRRQWTVDDASFMALLLCNWVWAVGYILSWPFKDPGALAYRMMFGAACFLPAAFLDFLIRSTKYASRRGVWGFLVVGILFFSDGVAREITRIWKIGIVVFVAVAMIFALVILLRQRQSGHPTVRSRAKYMNMAVLAAGFGGIADIVQGLTGRLPVTGALGSAVALLILAFATARLEVVAVHPMAMDLVVFGMLGVGYLGVGLLLDRLLAPVWVLVITAAIVLITIRPVADAIRLLLKQTLLGIRIQEEKILKEVRGEILSSKTEAELRGRFIRILNETFGLAYSSFTPSAASLSKEEIEILRRGAITTSAYDVLPAGVGGLYVQFESGSIGAAFGFFRDGEFAGLLKLSPKQNGRRFFPDEIGLIETLGEELTFAHENMRLGRREQLAKMGEAIAAVAHEIKNPLTTIIGSVEILRSANTDPGLQDVGNLAVSEMKRLKNLVNQYLEYARPYEPICRSFDLAALASAIAGTMEAVRVECGGSVFVMADESSIRQVLLNVIQNARDASPSMPVDVNVTQTGEYSLIQVHDRGPGLSETIRDRLFEPFATTKPGGTGMGLAICKRIVDAHGGDISITSGSGGTTVEIRLGARAT